MTNNEASAIVAQASGLEHLRRRTTEHDLDAEIESIVAAFAEREPDRGLLRTRLLILVSAAMRYCAVRVGAEVTGELLARGEGQG